MATLYSGFYKSATPYQRVRKSVNSGVSWSDVWNTNTVFFPRSIITYPDDNIIVVFASGNSNEGLIYRSANGGSSFDLLYNVAGAFIQDAQKSRQTADIIFACGKLGYFWKSTDKGFTFSYSQIPGYTANEFFGVSFVDDDIGFVAGGDYILKTINGGVDWTEKYNSSGMALVDIFAVDANIIWALPTASSNHILKSTDGGDTWNMISTTKSGSGHRIAGLAGDANHLWFVSRNGAGFHEITYTSDGGTVWNSTTAGLCSTSYSRRAPLFFLDANTGFCLGNHCYRSLDGGQTWADVGIIDASYSALAGMVERDFACEWRSFDVAGAEPTNRTTEGSAISVGNPLNFGSVGAGSNSPVKVVVFRAKSLGAYTTLSDLRFYLESKDLVGTNSYYCDITNTWTVGKTPAQVAAGTPGVCPQSLPGVANLTKIGGGDITGVGHADTSQYVYLCEAIGGDEVSGVDIDMNYRVQYDYV